MYDVTIVRINILNEYDDAVRRALANCHRFELSFHRRINFNHCACMSSRRWLDARPPVV